MKPTRISSSIALSLAGAALLTGLEIARLPPPADWLHPPQTPFDRSDAWPIRSSYLLLGKAARVIPAQARVTIRSEPADPVADSVLFRHAVALLPGRRVLPAARLDAPTPELARQAEYLVLLGAPPVSPQGHLLLETSDGSIWRRSP